MGALILPRNAGEDTRGFRVATLWIAAALALFCLALPAHADPTYPAFTGLVVDDAHVLSEADQADLTRKLTDLQDKTGVQFAVTTVPSLGGDEVEPYANALFRQWKIGQKGADNGLLLILAPNERKLRFEVGYGLEGTFTDVQSKLILHNTMVPKLKAGDAAGALKAGVDDAILVLTKDKASLPAHLQPAPQDDGGSAILFAIIFIVVLIIIFWMSRRRGGSFWSGWTTGAVVGSSTSSSWSNDSGGSSGGDSFSGGGGGDSGGGGASDSY